MSSNPFESPTDVEPMLEETPEEDWEVRYGRGSISMFVLGGLLGGAIAAGVGAVGAGIFAIVGSVIISTDSESLIFAAFGWAFIGALAGAISGAAMGAILGVVSAMIKARSRRRFSLGTIIASALIRLAHQPRQRILLSQQLVIELSWGEDRFSVELAQR